MRTWIGCLVALVLLVAAAGALVALWPGDDGAADLHAELWFVDATADSGLEFVHDAGDLSQYQLPQLHGSGVALFDFDGDGMLDLYLLTHGGPASRSINRLYRNRAGGKFQDVTEGSGLGVAGLSTGVAIGDVNNDGLPDVVLTQYGGVKLFLNRGNGKFQDVSDEAGLANPLWASSASFVDYDKDGWLDLVVVNYVENDRFQECHNPTSRRDYCGPAIFPGTVSKLFRNLGALGEGKARFEDVTVKAGLAAAAGPGLGVFCADFNGDGWPDIFIANYGRPNHLWINQEGRTFTNEAYQRGLAVDAMGQAQAGMGIAVGDVAGTGRFDVYVTHLAAERNTLWTQGPERGQFTDRTAAAGLLRSEWRGTGFGTVMGDFDNDGWLDIAVANGAIARGTATPNPALGAHLSEYSERNQLFRNEGQGKFRDVSRSNSPFCGTPNVARGLASGDLDGDGRLDLVVTTVGDRARIFRNVARHPGHWLLVRALDPRLKRDAYGASVIVRANSRRLLRLVNPGDSYQSSSDPRAHFGLGDADHFDGVHVLWPDGLAEDFSGGPADRVVVLRRGEGKPSIPCGVP